MFSLAYDGKLALDARVDKAALLAHLAESLGKLDARAIQISSDSVSFRGGFFRWVSNSNILIPFERGEIIVDGTSHQVRYRLSFRHLIFAANILVGLGAAMVWFDTKQPLVLLAFAFGWLWLVGANLATGIPRFRRFLRDAIASAPIET